MKTVKIGFTFVLFVCLATTLTLNGLAIGFRAEEAYDSVFIVYSGQNYGSGFAIGANCIISNAHVIGNQEKVTVEDYSGNRYNATVKVIDQQLDIVVLVVQGAKFQYLVGGEYGDIEIGEDVYAIGAPKSLSYTITKGIISAKERKEGDYQYLQIDAALNPGNSGGPLLNDKGQVIGVNTLKIIDSEGIGLSIPITTVSKFLLDNDIDVNDNGNVLQDIPLEKTEEYNNTVVSNVDSVDGNENSSDNRENMVLTALLILSGIMNIVLSLLLVLKNKKTFQPVYDATQRTDFEIELLE